MAGPTNEFPFFPDPPPLLVEILGAEFEMQSANIAIVLIAFPFMLGGLARRQAVWALPAAATFLLFVGLADAHLRVAYQVVESPVPFGWDYVLEVALWSLPAAVSGYLLALVFEKRAEKKNDHP